MGADYYEFAAFQSPTLSAPPALRLRSSTSFQAVCFFVCDILNPKKSASGRILGKLQQTVPPPRK